MADLGSFSAKVKEYVEKLKIGGLSLTSITVTVTVELEERGGDPLSVASTYRAHLYM